MSFDFHPESCKIIDFLKQNNVDRSSMTIDDIRKSSFDRNQKFTGGSDSPFEGTRHEQFIPSPHVKDGIPVFIYTPNKLKDKPALFVYVHGGGFVIGSRHGLDSACKVISVLAECIIINVEYRLAPEHKFPAQMEDAETVVQWVKQNKLKLGGSNLSKVGLGGDSAGGSITASVAHDVPMDFQVLVYPHVTKARDYTLTSFTKYKEGPLLTLPYIKWFENQYVPAGEEDNPRLASILRPSFSHLPPTLIIIAEHDPLYDGSWLYAKKLKEEGVSVQVEEYKGAIHAFFGATAFCPTLNKDAYNKVAEFISRIQAS